MTVPDAATRLAAVIGHPVGHSLSPRIQNAALRHDGVNAVFLAFDVAPERFESALDGLQALGAAGINVTLPHKLDALRLATHRSAEAERIGAANALVFAPDGIHAHNTDVVGVLGALKDLEVEPEGESCLVLGAGGAGRAAVWALQGAGARWVLVANRTAERARELASAVSGAEEVAWTDVEARIGEVSILVNATSVGLESEEAPLSAEALRRAAFGGCRVVLDLVYAPRETTLVRRAREAGIVAADGIGMLVHQAAASYRLFWGRQAPLEVMHEAAAHAVGREADRPGGAPPIV